MWLKLTKRIPKSPFGDFIGGNCRSSRRNYQRHNICSVASVVVSTEFPAILRLIFLRRGIRIGNRRQLILELTEAYDTGGRMGVLRETSDSSNPTCLTATQITSELLRHLSRFALRRVYVCLSNRLNPIVRGLVARAIV